MNKLSCANSRRLGVNHLTCCFSNFHCHSQHFGNPYIFRAPCLIIMASWHRSFQVAHNTYYVRRKHVISTEWTGQCETSHPLPAHKTFSTLHTTLSLHCAKTCPSSLPARKKCLALLHASFSAHRASQKSSDAWSHLCLRAQSALQCRCDATSLSVTSFTVQTVLFLHSASQEGTHSWTHNTASSFHSALNMWLRTTILFALHTTLSLHCASTMRQSGTLLLRHAARNLEFWKWLRSGETFIVVTGRIIVTVLAHHLREAAWYSTLLSTKFPYCISA